MTANSEYYKNIPRLNRFELNAYPTEESLAEALSRREVTAGAGVQSSTTDKLDGAAFTIKHYAIDNGVYLLLNTTSEILRDKTVRKALQLGLDTTAVREAAGDDLPALTLPILQAHFPDKQLPQVPAVNVSSANKLLDQAGWKRVGGVRKKANKELQLTITTIQNDQYVRAVDEITSQLEQLGVRVEKQIIDHRQPGTNFRQNILQQRNYDMLVYELQIGADPDVYAYWHSSQLGVSGYNFTNYSNGIADANLISARDNVDVSLRAAKYMAFARQWVGDVPAIGLYQQVFTYVVNHNATTLRDDTQLVTAADRYSNIEQWTVNRGTVYKTP